MLEARIPHDILKKMNICERGVYTVLKQFADWNTYTCYPSVRYLAEELDCSQNTVRKYLRSLEKKKIIKIQYRVETHKKTKHKYNKTNMYTLVMEKMLKGVKGVLQKKKETTSGNKDKQVLSNKLNDMSDNPEKIKVELHEKYGQVVVDRALQQLNIVTSKGTVVNHLKNYLDKICKGIQAQLNMVKGISQVEGNKSLKTASTQKKSPQPHLKGGWGSSNIQTSSKYTDDELESVIKRKRLAYSSK